MRLLRPLLLLALAAPATARSELPPPWMLAHPLPLRATGPAPPPSPLAAATPGQQYRAAIDLAERRYGIPPHLMAAIARVESGRQDGNGEVDPWPWSVDEAGVDHVYDTKAAAVEAVRAMQAQGVRSIDVGCMQVSLLYHPDAFASLEEAFDPLRNVDYAARFLSRLEAQSGSWQSATALYHSATPALGADYQRRVLAALPAEQGAALAAAFTQAGTRGAFMLSTHPSPARFLPLPPGAVGRGLAAYRAAPIRIASPVGLR